MKPSDYRLGSYETKQNNFYDGSLRLGFLAHVNDQIGIQQIHQAQLSAIKTHYLTIKKSAILNGLNKDILNFNNSIQNFDVNTNSIVNRINQDLENIRTSYFIDSPTVPKNTNISPEEINRAVSAANALLVQYSNVLNLIYQNVNSSSIIIDELVRIDKQLYALQSLIGQYTGEVQQNKDIHGYFWAIYSALHKLKGLQLESDVVTTASSWLPSNLKVVQTGQMYVGGKQSKLDNAVFSKSLLQTVKISYQVADKGNSKQKISKTVTLEAFFNDMEQNARQKSFYLSEGTYEKLCRQAVATLQSKAMSIRATKMYFGDKIQLFDNNTKKVFSKGQMRTLQSIQLAYKQYSTLYLQAIINMRDLYELSNQENSKTHRYKVSKQAGEKYQTFINYSLYKMIPKILGNNQFLLSNKYGIITFADFFAKESKSYFSWGTRKQVSLHNLENYNFDFLLNTI